MAVTIAATWLVGSRREAWRAAGFWTFLLSNALWLVWGWSAHAWALVALQVGLALMNVRGAYKNDV
jgi:hypothetical protein